MFANDIRFTPVIQDIKKSTQATQIKLKRNLINVNTNILLTIPVIKPFTKPLMKTPPRYIVYLYINTNLRVYKDICRRCLHFIANKNKK